MKKVVLKVDFNSTNADLEEIQLWLSTEWTNSKTGLFHQYSFLVNYHKMRSVAVLKLNDSVIGFVAWQPVLGIKTKLEYFSIIPCERRKKFGYYLAKAIMATLLELNVLVVDIICATEEAEFFWRSLGAIEFPYMWNYFNKSYTNLFLPLCKIQDRIAEDHPGMIIHVRGREVGDQDCVEQTYTWPVCFRTGSRFLEYPIIFPVNRNWRIIWRDALKIFYDGPIHGFFGQSNLTEPLMVIQELPISA